MNRERKQPVSRVNQYFKCPTGGLAVLLCAHALLSACATGGAQPRVSPPNCQLRAWPMSPSFEAATVVDFSFGKEGAEQIDFLYPLGGRGLEFERLRSGELTAGSGQCATRKRHIWESLVTLRPAIPAEAWRDVAFRSNADSLVVAAGVYRLVVRYSPIATGKAARAICECRSGAFRVANSSNFVFTE